MKQFALRSQDGIRPHQEVMVSHKYKFIYVNIRKSASSTLRIYLRKQFQVGWDWCIKEIREMKAKGKEVQMEEPNNKRCTTRYLSEDMVKSYFIFTFVRDPIDRVLSGYAEWTAQRKITGNISHFQQAMEQSLSSGLIPNEHLESQIKSLNTEWRDGVRLPLDYIGRVERFYQDWKSILRLIQFHSGLRLPLNRAPERQYNLRKEKPIRKVDLDRRVLQLIAYGVYAQDYTCFGYQKPLL